MCKTSAVSRADDGKVGLKVDSMGIQERLLDYLSKSKEPGHLKVHQKLYDDLLGLSAVGTGSELEDWGSLASMEVAEHENDIERNEHEHVQNSTDQFGDDGKDEVLKKKHSISSAISSINNGRGGGASERRHESDIYDGLKNSAKISGLLDEFENNAYQKMAEEFEGMSNLEQKVKRQAEVISIMERSLEKGNGEEILNDSRASEEYDDDFESSQKISPEKRNLSQEATSSLEQKYQSKEPERYQPKLRDSVLERSIETMHNHSATSDILSMADKLLNDDEYDQHNEVFTKAKKSIVVKRKKKNKKRIELDAPIGSSKMNDQSQPKNHHPSSNQTVIND